MCSGGTTFLLPNNSSITATPITNRDIIIHCEYFQEVDEPDSEQYLLKGYVSTMTHLSNLILYYERFPANTSAHFTERQTTVKALCSVTSQPAQ